MNKITIFTVIGVATMALMACQKNTPSAEPVVSATQEIPTKPIVPAVPSQEISDVPIAHDASEGPSTPSLYKSSAPPRQGEVKIPPQ